MQELYDLLLEQSTKKQDLSYKLSNINWKLAVSPITLMISEVFPELDQTWNYRDEFKTTTIDKVIFSSGQIGSFIDHAKSNFESDYTTQLINNLDVDFILKMILFQAYSQDLLIPLIKTTSETCWANTFNKEYDLFLKELELIQYATGIDLNKKRDSKAFFLALTSQLGPDNIFEAVGRFIIEHTLGLVKLLQGFVLGYLRDINKTSKTSFLYHLEDVFYNLFPKDSIFHHLDDESSDGFKGFSVVKRVIDELDEYSSDDKWQRHLGALIDALNILRSHYVVKFDAGKVSPIFQNGYFKIGVEYLTSSPAKLSLICNLVETWLYNSKATSLSKVYIENYQTHILYVAEKLELMKINYPLRQYVKTSSASFDNIDLIGEITKKYKNYKLRFHPDIIRDTKSTILTNEILHLNIQSDRPVLHTVLASIDEQIDKINIDLILS